MTFLKYSTRSADSFVLFIAIIAGCACFKAPNQETSRLLRSLSTYDSRGHEPVFEVPYKHFWFEKETKSDPLRTSKMYSSSRLKNPIMGVGHLNNHIGHQSDSHHVFRPERFGNFPKPDQYSSETSRHQTNFYDSDDNLFNQTLKNALFSRHSDSRSNLFKDTLMTESELSNVDLDSLLAEIKNRVAKNIEEQQRLVFATIQHRLNQPSHYSHLSPDSIHNQNDYSSFTRSHRVRFNPHDFADNYHLDTYKGSGDRSEPRESNDAYQARIPDGDDHGGHYSGTNGYADRMRESIKAREDAIKYFARYSGNEKREERDEVSKSRQNDHYSSYQHPQDHHHHTSRGHKLQTDQESTSHRKDETKQYDENMNHHHRHDLSGRDDGKNDHRKSQNHDGKQTSQGEPYLLAKNQHHQPSDKPQPKDQGIAAEEPRPPASSSGSEKYSQGDHVAHVVHENKQTKVVDPAPNDIQGTAIDEPNPYVPKPVRYEHEDRYSEPKKYQSLSQRKVSKVSIQSKNGVHDVHAYYQLDKYGRNQPN